MSMHLLIIGGSKNVISLLDTLGGLKDVKLVALCDVEKDSVGMQHARKLGIDTYIDLGKCLDQKKIDIIIETSGSKEFQKILKVSLRTLYM